MEAERISEIAPYLPLLAGALTRRAYETGNLKEGLIDLGPAVAYVRSLQTVEQIYRRTDRRCSRGARAGEKHGCFGTARTALTAIGLNAGPPAMKIIDFLDRGAAISPNGICLHDDAHSFTYREVVAYTNRIAARVARKRHDVGQEDCDLQSERRGGLHRGSRRTPRRLHHGSLSTRATRSPTISHCSTSTKRNGYFTIAISRSTFPRSPRR